jgi:hypothetical protein
MSEMVLISNNNFLPLNLSFANPYADSAVNKMAKKTPTPVISKLFNMYRENGTPEVETSRASSMKLSSVGLRTKNVGG